MKIGLNKDFFKKLKIKLKKDLLKRELLDPFYLGIINKFKLIYQNYYKYRDHIFFLEVKSYKILIFLNNMDVISYIFININFLIKIKAF